MNLNLTDKRALVCGSSQGIGRAAAEALARLGAEVILVARNEERLLAVREGLARPKQQSHSYLVADFAKPEHLRKVVTDLVASRSVDILINNTGGPAGGLIHQAKTAEFVDAFSKHLICNHILTQAVLGGMKEKGYGRIINIISTSVKQPIDNLGVSNTTRGAVASWAKTMANELGPFGITVNNVLPGMTETQRLQSILQKRSEQQGISIEEVAKNVKAGIPARRFATSEEVAAAIAFLASPSAGYINGINLPVDGGRTRCL